MSSTIRLVLITVTAAALLTPRWSQADGDVSILNGYIEAVQDYGRLITFSDIPLIEAREGQMMQNGDFTIGSVGITNNVPEGQFGLGLKLGGNGTAGANGVSGGVVAGGSVSWNDRVSVSYHANSLSEAFDFFVVFPLLMTWEVEGDVNDSGIYEFGIGANGVSEFASYDTAHQGGFWENSLNLPPGNSGFARKWIVGRLQNVRLNAFGNSYIGDLNIQLNAVGEARAAQTLNAGNASGDAEIEFRHGSIELYDWQGGPVEDFSTSEYPSPYLHGATFYASAETESESGLSYGATRSSPGVASGADFDGDSDVDGRDFLIWQRGFGLTGSAATQAAGNADGDMDIDGADLDVWRGAFGGAAVSAASSLPEPTALTLAGFFVAIVATRRLGCAFVATPGL